jgi:hypothetical protein
MRNRGLQPRSQWSPHRLRDIYIRGLLIIRSHDINQQQTGVCLFSFSSFFPESAGDGEREESGRVTQPQNSSSYQFGDDAIDAYVPSTTTSAINQSDQKRGWHPSLKFFLSFAFGSFGVMLATTPLSPQWSFTLLNTRIEFRSMFVATLFLFIFLFLGQYSPPLSYLPPFPFPFYPLAARHDHPFVLLFTSCLLSTSSLTAHTSF